MIPIEIIKKQILEELNKDKKFREEIIKILNKNG